MASLTEYLKRYTGEDVSKEADKKKKKRKKKDSQTKVKTITGLQIVDDDVRWQKEIKEESADEDVDDVPQVEEDVEVKRLHKIEQAKAYRPYLSIGDDGSGWVSVKEEKVEADSSPPRRGRGDRESDRTLMDRNRHDPPENGNVRKTEPYSDHTLVELNGNSGRPSTRHDSPDLSPPRKTEMSIIDPVGRQRHDSTDMSPPRRVRDGSPDLSPPRKVRRDSPRISAPTRVEGNSSDLSPPRKGRHDSPDLSPPRRVRNDSPDLLPLRKSQVDSAAAPPQGNRRRFAPDSPGHTVEQNRSQEASASLNFSRPPKDEDLSPPRKRPSRPEDTDRLQRQAKSGAQRMTDGTKAGLRTGKEVSAELDQKRRDDVARFKELDASVTGRGAETVYRDKQGKKSNLDQIMEESKASKRKELPPPVWGKGLAQQRMAQHEASDLAAASTRPFALQSDADLDKQMRERVRWGDPMAHLVKQKEAEFLLPDLGDNEAMRESGFKIPQEIPPHSWLKRRINPPPNRFDIRPGRHWDGVDRSTGFEQQLFKQKNESKAQETEAYLWSVSDM